MTLKTSDNPALAAGLGLGGALWEAKGEPVLLLLSGGSSLALLAHIEASAFGPHVTIAVIDERYGFDTSQSNFARLSQTDFFAKEKAAGCVFIDSRPRDGESLEKFAARFEQSLRAWQAAYPNGRIIVTLGFGADGHMAGIAPFPENPAHFSELFHDESRWVRGYDAGGKLMPPERVTVTASFLKNEVACAVVFAVGAEKQAALTRIRANEGTLAETPARVVRLMKDATIFTDIWLWPQSNSSGQV